MLKLNKAIVKDLYKSLGKTLINFKASVDAHKDYEPSENEKAIDKAIEDLVALIEKE